MTEIKQNPPAESQQQQDTEQKEVKFADKFKSVEELEKAYKEAERKIQELAERSKRAEELLETLISQQTSAPTYTTSEVNNEDYYSKLIENPKETLEKFASELERRIISKIKTEQEMTEYARKLHEYFYTKYSDLKGYEPIVGYFADIYQKQYPNEKLENLLEKIAEASRAYIADKKLKSQQGEKPLNVAEPSSAKISSSTEKTSSEERLLSPDEELQQYLEERTKERLKKLI